MKINEIHWLIKFTTGIVLGVAIGAGTGNLGLGIGIGVALGAALSQGTWMV